MKVLIADDEPLALDLLRHFLTEMPDVEIVGEAGDGAELFELFRLHPIDVVISDIGMPGLDGLQAAQDMLRDAEPSHIPQIIFTTADPRHAVSAFDVGATDYLLKPVERDRLVQALGRARAQRGLNGVSVETWEEAIWVPSQAGRTRLALRDIVRVEAADDHVYLHTTHKTYLHRITMKALEERLAATDLVRVHRSSFIRLVDVREVRRLGKGVQLMLDDGSRISLGSRYRRILDRLEADGLSNTRVSLTTARQTARRPSVAQVSGAERGRRAP